MTVLVADITGFPKPKSWRESRNHELLERGGQAITNPAAEILHR
jgi:hypothetical protein